uniref:Uncharacterized protein n=1 Tax=viral metagenome TaxID=1070528 RepID=A0A6C0CKP9_9ZZZZ
MSFICLHLQPDDPRNGMPSDRVYEIFFFGDERDPLSIAREHLCKYRDMEAMESLMQDLETKVTVNSAKDGSVLADKDAVVRPVFPSYLTNREYEKKTLQQLVPENTEEYHFETVDDKSENFIRYYEKRFGKNFVGLTVYSTKNHIYEGKLMEQDTFILSKN